MAFTFDPIFATDPNNAQNVASNAAIIIFDPADVGQAPITITDVTGAALPNPITVNKNGFGPAFVATIDRVAWSGAGFTGYFTSYEGMKLAATDAATAAEAAQAAAEAAGVDAAGVAEAALAGAVADAEAAQAAAETAAGLVGAPADTAVETLINTPVSATAVALKATYASTVKSAAMTIGDKPLYRRGLVLRESRTTGVWDTAMTESPFVFHDPQTGKYAMIFTAYSAFDATAVASHGIAYSTDGIRWTDKAQYFTASGTPGAPDEKGVTGPVVVFDEGIQHLFYIGLDQVGYEAGNKTLCHASRPIGGTWTRHGAVSLLAGGTGWRKTHIWRPNFVKSGSTWYCFINATGDPSADERVGVAEAPSLDGPWTWRDDINPVIPDIPGALDVFNVHAGDPFVTQLSDGSWRMDFYRVDGELSGNGKAFNMYATTTPEQFPGGWVVRGVTVKPGAAGTYDYDYAHKPHIVNVAGETYHYYTAALPGYRYIALSTSERPAPPIVRAITGTESIVSALVRSGAGLDAATAQLSDNFTRANGAVGNATTGQAWTTDAGWAIASNKLVFTGTADGAAWIDAGALEWDAEIILDAVTANQYPFGIGAGDPAGAWLKLYRDGTTWVYRTMNVGTATTPIVRTLAPTLTAGTIMLRRRLGRLTLEHNGTIINAFSVDQAGTKLGILGSGNQGLTISRLTVIRKV